MLYIRFFYCLGMSFTVFLLLNYIDLSLCSIIITLVIAETLKGNHFPFLCILTQIGSLNTEMSLGCTSNSDVVKST